MVPIALGILWLGGWWFAAAATAVAIYATVEWNRVTASARPALTVVNATTLVLAAAALLEVNGWTALVFLGVGAVLVLGVAAVRRAVPFWPVFGLAYLGVALLSLVWLRQAGGFFAVLWVLLIIWGSDIGAYLTGSLLGGPKLAPRLSPNKTWAGLLGGAVLAGAVSTGVVLLAPPGLAALSSPAPMFLVGFVLAVWSQAGDILESTIKRRFNVKDSGTLIPGHGGVLDRIDSLIFTVPVVALAFFLQN